MLRDFLEMYNKLVFHCFEKCIYNFNHMIASNDEMGCINVCIDKNVAYNQRHMKMFIEYQQVKNKRAAEEAQAVAAAAAAATPAPSATVESAQSLALSSSPISTSTSPSTSMKLDTSGSVADAGYNSVASIAPENVCYSRFGHPSLAEHVAHQQLETTLQFNGSLTYKGKSVVDQFLKRSDHAELHFV